MCEQQDSNSFNPFLNDDKNGAKKLRVNQV